MNFAGFLYALAWAALCVFLLLFLSKRLAWFLERQEEERPGVTAQAVYRLSRILCIVGVAYLGLHYFQHGPPNWANRINQRRIVGQRIEAAGGWTNLAHGCATFVSTNDPSYFRFFLLFHTNLVLPAVLEAMQPKEIEGENRDGLKTVSLRLFGSHSAKMHTKPNYRLLVVLEGKPDLESLAKRRFPKASLRKLSDNIWEVF